MARGSLPKILTLFFLAFVLTDALVVHEPHQHDADLVRDEMGRLMKRSSMQKRAGSGSFARSNSSAISGSSRTRSRSSSATSRSSIVSGSTRIRANPTVGSGTGRPDAVGANRTVSLMSTKASASPSPTQYNPHNCDAATWNATQDNWFKADVDGQLKSWALDDNPNAPTSVHYDQQTWPTKLPRINKGFGTYAGLDGVPAELISIAKGGQQGVSCKLNYGENGQCPPPPSVPEVCGFIPIWAYFAWVAIYNAFSIHYAVISVLTVETAYQLGQADAIVDTFAVDDSQNMLGVEMFLTILGAVATVIGVLVPLAAIGVAAWAEMSTADILKATLEGGLFKELRQAGYLTKADLPVPKSRGHSDVQPDGDEIHPVSGGGVNHDDAPEGGQDTVPVLQKPTGQNPKTTHPGFIGNAVWVAPGVMTGMANSLWQQVEGAESVTAKQDLNAQAVTNYLMNVSETIIDYNDALFASMEPKDVESMLGVLKGASFIEVEWSQSVFELAISADVISRELNSLWQSTNAGAMYIQFTDLDDDKNGTKCQKNMVGVPTTRVCGDGGIYYMNYINSYKLYPFTAKPQGFDSLLDYGIIPWWPTSAGSSLYRTLNPDPKSTDLKFRDEKGGSYGKYIEDFVTASPGGMLELVGQMPGEWTAPVCDQGQNLWAYDWSDDGGLEYDVGYDPGPCSCGWQGKGTAEFVKTLGLAENVINYMESLCDILLMTVDPTLPLSLDNIGWKRIAGGPPDDKKIVLSDDHTVTMPDPMPTKACYPAEFQRSACTPLPPPPDECMGITCYH